jgi:hypothetical protein
MLYILLNMDKVQLIDARCYFQLENNRRFVIWIRKKRDRIPESFGARFNAPISVNNALSTDIISAVRGLKRIIIKLMIKHLNHTLQDAME